MTIDFKKMNKYFFIISLLISTSTFSQRIIVSSYRSKNYNYQDTLKYTVKNASAKKIKMWFSLEIFDKKWIEIDGDIYEKKDKVYHFFYLSPKSRKHFKYNLNSIDISILNNCIKCRYRIVLNSYKIHPFKLSRYYCNEFIIDNR